MEVPASRASGDGWDEVGYPTAGPGRPSFVFPPPRQSSGSPEEYGRVIGEQMREWGDLAESTADEVHNLGDVLVDYGDQLEELGRNRVMPWAVPTVAPLSQTINRQADPTFQLQGFMTITGRTGTTDGHTHPLGTPGGTAWQLAEGWNEQSRIYVAFITPAVTRAYQQLNFMVGAVSGTPSALEVAVFLLDENRILTRQVGPLTVEGIGQNAEWATVTFDTFVAEQGSYIGIAFRQFGDNRRPLLGLVDTVRPLSGAVFPPRIGARHTEPYTPIPAVIDGETQLDFEHNDSWFVPYAELSEHVGIDYRHFTEAWGHGSVAPRPWVPLTNTGIWSNENGYARAGGDGYRVSMYDTPLSTDTVRVRTTIRGIQSNNSRRSTLIVRGTNNLRTGIGLSAINRSGAGLGGVYELIQWADRDVNSDWDNRTVVATINQIPQEGDQLEVDYLDGQVAVRINGTEHITNQTVGGPEGASGRFLGIQVDRNSDLFNTWWSPWLGPWSARDLPQDNGGDDDEGDGDGGDEEP